MPNVEQHLADELEKIQYRDSIKREWCQKRGVPLLEIPYWQYEQVGQIVSDFISN